MGSLKNRIMAYTIREQNLNAALPETQFDYSFVVKKDYRDLKYDELERHVKMLEEYSKNLIDYIIMAEYPLKYKSQLHSEMDNILNQLHKSKQRYQTFTIRD
jgi:hypothetical protein